MNDLKGLSADYPQIKILSVIKYELNEYGFYNVLVQCEGNIKSRYEPITMTLPYPRTTFTLLSPSETEQWHKKIKDAE